MTTPTPRTDATIKFVREQLHNDDYPDDHAAYAVAYLGGELIKMERALAAREAELAELMKWKEAVLNELIVAYIYTKEHETNPLKAIRDAITWNCQVALDPAVSSDAQRLRDTYLQRAEAAERKAERYESRLFALGAMDDAPCFKCGYNGAGYYQQSTHPCAALHHAAIAAKGDLE